MPAVRRFPDEELDARPRGRVRLGDGTRPSEIAVLVRMNAQLVPMEEAFTRAGLAYQVRGERFYERPEVRAALGLRPRRELTARGPGAARRDRGRWPSSATRRARPPRAPRRASAQASLGTLLEILEDLVAKDPGHGPSVLAEIEARAAHEHHGSAYGVNLLTYHRAKGMEWDAVFLPTLEEGTLPIRQALDDDEALAEERRLLYVGITRARIHLALSWAERRDGARPRGPRRSRAGSCWTCGRRRGRAHRAAAGAAARSPAAPPAHGGSAVRRPSRVADGPRAEATRCRRT